MFAASSLNCPTRPWGTMGSEFELAQWTKLGKAGSRQIGVEGQCREFSTEIELGRTAICWTSSRTWGRRTSRSRGDIRDHGGERNVEDLVVGDRCSIHILRKKGL